MLRINLLRQLPASDRPEAPEPSSSGVGKRALWALVLLLIAGGAGWYLARRAAAPPPVAAPSIVESDSLARARDALASQDLAARQDACAGLLRDLGDALPPGAGFGRIVITPPHGFLATGTVPSEQDLSRFQEALALLPGMDLRQSDASIPDSAKPERGFAFSGTVRYPMDDSLDTGNRVIPQAQWNTEWEAFVTQANQAGVAFSAPETGAVSIVGGLQAHSYRVSARCDYPQILNLLENLRGGRSPIGVHRLVLEGRNDSLAIILDIMAYTR